MKLHGAAYITAAIALLYVAAALNTRQTRKTRQVTLARLSQNRFAQPEFIFLGRAYAKRQENTSNHQASPNSAQDTQNAPSSCDITQQSVGNDLQQKHAATIQEIQRKDDCYLDQIVSIVQQQNQLQNTEKANKLLAFGKYGFRMGPFSYNKRAIASGKLGSQQAGSECQSAAVLDDR